VSYVYKKFMNEEEYNVYVRIYIKVYNAVINFYRNYDINVIWWWMIKFIMFIVLF
jgi:hypothetical protein